MARYEFQLKSMKEIIQDIAAQQGIAVVITEYPNGTIGVEASLNSSQETNLKNALSNFGMKLTWKDGALV